MVQREEFEPSDETKKRMDEAADALPDGKYWGVCPGCGAKVTLSINWSGVVFRGVVMALAAVAALLIGLHAFGG